MIPNSAPTLPLQYAVSGRLELLVVVVVFLPIVLVPAVLVYRDAKKRVMNGETHVLLAGPADGTPVVVLRGGNATDPMTLHRYGGLAEEYRLIAPDTVGQPGFGGETRVKAHGDSFGEWVGDPHYAFEIQVSSSERAVGGREAPGERGSRTGEREAMRPASKRPTSHRASRNVFGTLLVNRSHISVPHPRITP